MKIAREQGNFMRNQITDFEAVFEDAAPKGETFYYAKAVQIDGGLAWSSPIFVKGV